MLIDEREATEREVTAYHESAHAVVCRYYSVGDLDVVSIRPSRGAAGRVKWRLTAALDPAVARAAGVPLPARPVTPAEWIDRRVLAMLAGPAAEYLVTGIPDDLVYRGGDSDRRDAAACLAMHGRDPDLGPWVRRAVVLVGRPYIWRAVRALAVALLDRDSLDRWAVESIVDPLLPRSRWLSGPDRARRGQEVA